MNRRFPTGVHIDGGSHVPSIATTASATYSSPVTLACRTPQAGPITTFQLNLGIFCLFHLISVILAQPWVISCAGRGIAIRCQDMPCHIRDIMQTINYLHVPQLISILGKYVHRYDVWVDMFKAPKKAEPRCSERDSSLR